MRVHVRRHRRRVTPKFVEKESQENLHVAAKEKCKNLTSGWKRGLSISTVFLCPVHVSTSTRWPWNPLELLGSSSPQAHAGCSSSDPMVPGHLEKITKLCEGRQTCYVFPNKIGFGVSLAKDCWGQSSGLQGIKRGLKGREWEGRKVKPSQASIIKTKILSFERCNLIFTWSCFIIYMVTSFTG